MFLQCYTHLDVRCARAICCHAMPSINRIWGNRPREPTLETSGHNETILLKEWLRFHMLTDYDEWVHQITKHWEAEEDIVQQHRQKARERRDHVGYFADDVEKTWEHEDTQRRRGWMKEAKKQRDKYKAHFEFAWRECLKFEKIMEARKSEEPVFDSRRHIPTALSSKPKALPRQLATSLTSPFALDMAPAKKPQVMPPNANSYLLRCVRVVPSGGGGVKNSWARFAPPY